VACYAIAGRLGLQLASINDSVSRASARPTASARRLWTANAMKGDRERCLESGMDDYIAKPVDACQLDRVLDLLSSARADPAVA
jgi:CheY-like chemotaxis protein